MSSCEKSGITTAEAPPVETNHAVRARLRTLLELAITIGKREGLLGKNGDFHVEIGQSALSQEGR